MDYIKDILDEEELLFTGTIDRGVQLFEQYAAEANKSDVKVVSNDDVWHLYNVYGFPIDLTRVMAHERGLTVSELEFEKTQAGNFGKQQMLFLAHSSDLEQFSAGSMYCRSSQFL